MNSANDLNNSQDAKKKIIDNIDKSMPFYNKVQKYLNMINRLTILKTFILSSRVSVLNIGIRFALLCTILVSISYSLTGQFSDVVFAISAIYGLIGRFTDTLLINIIIKLINLKMIRYMKDNAPQESFVLEPMYRYADAALYIKQSICSEKAKTLGEAYKMYDTYAHQKRIEGQLSLMSQLMINQY